jgi:hypothetical protein
MLPVYSIVESTHLYSLAGVYPCLPLGSTKLRFEALKMRFNYVLRVSNHPSRTTLPFLSPVQPSFTLFLPVCRLSTSPYILPCVFDSQRPTIHGDDMLFQKQTKLVFRHRGTVHVVFQSRVRNLPICLLWLVRSRGIFRALHHVDFHSCTV